MKAKNCTDRNAAPYGGPQALTLYPGYRIKPGEEVHLPNRLSKDSHIIELERSGAISLRDLPVVASLAPPKPKKTRRRRKKKND